MALESTASATKRQGASCQSDRNNLGRTEILLRRLLAITMRSTGEVALWTLQQRSVLPQVSFVCRAAAFSFCVSPFDVARYRSFGMYMQCIWISHDTYAVYTYYISTRKRKSLRLKDPGDHVIPNAHILGHPATDDFRRRCVVRRHLCDDCRFFLLLLFKHHHHFCWFCGQANASWR